MRLLIKLFSNLNRLLRLALISSLFLSAFVYASLPEVSRFDRTDKNNDTSIRYFPTSQLESEYVSDLWTYDSDKSGVFLKISDLYGYTWNDRESLSILYYEKSKDSENCTVIGIPLSEVEGVEHKEIVKVKVEIGSETKYLKMRYLDHKESYKEKNSKKGVGTWNLSHCIDSKTGELTENSVNTGDSLKRLIKMLGDNKAASKIKITHLGGVGEWDLYGLGFLIDTFNHLKNGGEHKERGIIWLDEPPKDSAKKYKDKRKQAAIKKDFIQVVQNPVSKVTFNKIDSEAGCNSNYSDTRKDDLFGSKYENKWFTMIGTVVKPSADHTGLKFLSGTFTYDLRVEFTDNNAGYNLLEGQRIKVKYKMISQGGCFVPFRGENAKIVKVY